MSNLLEGTSVSAVVGGAEITIETGRMARQADGAVWVQAGGTVVLVTAVTQPLQRDIDFMPLVVDYQEMAYAAGRIPGSFFRREIGRPSERETLVSRLTDRPIRPLFPKGFRDEVQIISTVLSADPEHDPDVLAITGASTALHISRIPFMGPIAGIRVGYIDGQFVANPSFQAVTEDSSINIILAGSREAVVMVEGSARFEPEKLLHEAIAWGHEQLQPLLDVQEKLREQVGVEKMEFTAPEPDAELSDLVMQTGKPELESALSIPDKMERRRMRHEIKDKLIQAATERFPEEPERLKQLPELIKDVEKSILRSRIKESGTRLDGRDLTSVRDIEPQVGVLPRTHGSALFARGETKVLAVATLGSTRDEQRIDSLQGDSTKRFMLHYNFPPYCVGEAKMLRGPTRREIGHGMLAERALTPVLPDPDEFPFTLRIVSEVMESNGSSSMASVCGGSLAFMDAGVPIKAQVAGIAMGLIKEGDEYMILTDILGEEDMLGDMDFKVAGTAEGVTAIQMDIKVTGIPPEVMAKALDQARQAKLHILEKMNAVLDKPRSELSPYAPQLEIITINPEKIGSVIGPGGKHIKGITEASGAAIDIEDDGRVFIFAPSLEAMELAKKMVEYYDQTPELGKDYEGTVKKVVDFGAVVEFLPGVEGLVHISQLDTQRVEKVSDVVKLGDTVKVKVIEMDESGNKIRLSRKAIIMEERGETFDIAAAARPKRDSRGRGGPRDNRGRSGGYRRR